MTLENWALIAEIVGSVAVVISLIFVGVQLQANTSATRSATASAASSSTSAWYIAMGGLTQASALFFNFMNDPISADAGNSDHCNEHIDRHDDDRDRANAVKRGPHFVTLPGGVGH